MWRGHSAISPNDPKPTFAFLADGAGVLDEALQ
jgi:hypothetical protein